MEVFLIKALQFFLSLSILVVLHELGHFLPAKLFGARVEKFYMFFDYKWSLFKFKKGDTEYGIGWIPLGGYVKISGMVDESMDTDQLKKDPEPWEFRSKPAWQRLIILIGGVTVNIILAMVIYAGIMFVWGEKYLPNDNLKGGIWVVDSLATEIGFETGDKILDINGNKVERFNGVMAEMLYGGDVRVQRQDGGIETLTIPDNFVERLIEEDKKLLFDYRIPFVVGKIPDSSINASSGLQQNDMLLALNGVEFTYFDEFKAIASQFKGQQVPLMIERDGQREELSVQVSEKGLIEVVPGNVGLIDLSKMGFYELETKSYTFLESIPAGVNRGLNQINGYLKQLKLIFNFNTGAYKGVGGFAAIGNLFPSQWDWEIFWNMTAFLSIMLAVLNLLPIPALDGGHVMFTLWEMVTGRKPSDRFMEYAQMVGLVILLSLFLFANGNDIYKLVFK